jgi:transcriptional regulator with XRE-family HTH domain
LSSADGRDADGCKAQDKRPLLATATEISRIENGQRDVQISTIFKLAKAFDLTPGQFIDGDLTTTTDRT